MSISMVLVCCLCKKIKTGKGAYLKFGWEEEHVYLRVVGGALIQGFEVYEYKLWTLMFLGKRMYFL